MHVTGGKNEASVWFVERKGTITGRYAYDEDAVVKDCIVSDRFISRAGPSNYTAIEMIVAMTKRLHNVMAFLRRVNGYFTRLDLKRLLRARGCTMNSNDCACRGTAVIADAVRILRSMGASGVHLLFGRTPMIGIQQIASYVPAAASTIWADWGNSVSTRSFFAKRLASKRSLAALTTRIPPHCAKRPLLPWSRRRY